MSQRRYGKIIAQNGEEVDDPEQAELAEEMGRLSPSGTTRSRGAGGLFSGASRPASGRPSIASRIGMLAIWLFIVVSFVFALATGTSGIDTVNRISSSWGWGSSPPIHPDDLWVKGSGRQDLHFNSTFNPDDLTMTSDECDAFFPDLYAEIDRSAKFYSEKQE